jgi:hypothetical protein
MKKVTQVRKKFKLYSITKSVKLVEYLKSREIHFTENNQYPNLVWVNLHVTPRGDELFRLGRDFGMYANKN